MAEPPPQGVYHQVVTRSTVTEKDLYIPHLLTASYFVFLWQFWWDPFENPVFAREWRRNKRRLGFLAVYWKSSLAVGVLLSLLVGVLVNFAVAAAGTGPLAQALMTGLFFGPSFIASFIAFFTSINAVQGVASRSALQEMALTPLKPQEFAFGHLAGGILPLSLPFLAVVPGMALIGFDRAIRAMFIEVNGGLFFSNVGFALLFYPNVLSAMASSAAIASGIAAEGENSSNAFTTSLTVWIGLGFLLALIHGYAILAWPYSFIVAPFVLMGARVIIASGFLHHLAVRIAMQKAEEVDAVIGKAGDGEA
ncbi:hypothetical protein BH09SUM1_BH09SUM1_07810 [soil metagenome]